MALILKNVRQYGIVLNIITTIICMKALNINLL